MKHMSFLGWGIIRCKFLRKMDIRLKAAFLSFLMMSATIIVFTAGSVSAHKANLFQGVWINSYGSIMKLDDQGGMITGCYSSTTGSSGAYRVIGFSDSNPDPKSKATTLAIAVPWRSYLGGKGDTSWHWTSTMSGILFLDKNEEKLELINALNTSTLLVGQNAAIGLYPESLTFTRHSNQSWQCPEPPAKEYSSSSLVIGTWKGEDITLVIEKDLGDGFFAGHYIVTGTTFPVVGCYDYVTTSPVPAPAGIRSVSLVVSNEDSEGNNHHSQLALVGMLREKENELDLYMFQTFPLTKYTSNKLRHVSLVKEINKHREATPDVAKGTGVMVLPVRMGLARNNGATPWYVELAIGEGFSSDHKSDYQLFKFIFDTGTSSTWVTSKECNTVPCKHHRRYDYNLSATHIWIDQKEQASELGPWGEFRFKVSQDTWHVFAENPQQDTLVRRLYSVPNMKFLEATALIDGKNPNGTTNTNWDDLVQDGSLAIPSESAGSPSTQLLDLLVAKGYVGRKLVSYWTSRNLNRGEAIFGDLNESRYDPASLRYYPVSRNLTTVNKIPALWAVKLVELRVGDSIVGLPSADAAFVLDTGSSRFKGDPTIIDNIIRLITANGIRSQTVTNPADLDSYPDFTIVLVDENGDQNEYTLTAHEYFQEFPDSWHLAFHGLQPTKNSSAANLLLAGSIFLDHYYSVYDYTTDPVRVGIAKRVDP